MLKKLKSLKLPKLNLSHSIKLPKFSKSSESTATAGSVLSGFPQPTKSIKSITSFTFDKTKTAKAASSMVLFGLSGWFLWHTFLAAPEGTLPPSLPPAIATISSAPAMQSPVIVVESIETAENLAVAEPEELIEGLLVATETQKETANVTNQISPDKPHDLDVLMKAEQSVTKVSESALCEKPCIDNSTPETITVMDAPTSEAVPEKNHQYALTTRSNLDARECLSLTENMNIHRCAENYR